MDKPRDEDVRHQDLQEERYHFPYHYLSLELDEYRLIWHLEYLELLASARRALGPPAGRRVLDAGCGDGRFCHEVAGEDCTVVGVDLSERAIAFARAFNPDVDFRVGDLADLAARESFDAAVLIDTLEHIPPEECPAVVANLADTLVPAGTLVVTVPSTKVPVGPKHHRHFDETALREVLEPRFDVLRVEGFSRLGSARRRYQRRVKLLVGLWGLRRKLGWIVPWAERLAAEFRQRFAVGRPDECSWLVATCRRRSEGT